MKKFSFHFLIWTFKNFFVQNYGNLTVWGISVRHKLHKHDPKNNTSISLSLKCKKESTVNDVKNEIMKKYFKFYHNDVIKHLSHFFV